MYLSCLDLDPNPYRRLTQLWLANPYRIHQRLCMAFREPGRVLFRLEERPNARLLVQSTREPDWGAAFDGFPVLAGPPRSKPFQPVLGDGRRFRFRLRANPTIKREGRRHGLTREEDQLAWLTRKGEEGGFAVLSVQPSGNMVQLSRKSRQRGADAQRHLAVEFNGVLRVVLAERFGATLENGIGSAKAYGFGMLSIAPAQ